MSQYIKVFVGNMEVTDAKMPLFVAIQCFQKPMSDAIFAQSWPSDDWHLRISPKCSMPAVLVVLGYLQDKVEASHKTYLRQLRQNSVVRLIHLAAVFEAISEPYEAGILLTDALNALPATPITPVVAECVWQYYGDFHTFAHRDFWDSPEYLIIEALIARIIAQEPVLYHCKLKNRTPLWKFIQSVPHLWMACGCYAKRPEFSHEDMYEYKDCQYLYTESTKTILETRKQALRVRKTDLDEEFRMMSEYVKENGEMEEDLNTEKQVRERYWVMVEEALEEEEMLRDAMIESLKGVPVSESDEEGLYD